MAQFKVSYFQLFSYTAPLPVHWEKEAALLHISPGNDHISISSVSCNVKEEAGFIKRNIDIDFSSNKIRREDDHRQIFLFAEKNLANVKQSPEWMELKTSAGYAFPLQKEKSGTGVKLKFHQLFIITGKLPRNWEEQMSGVEHLKLLSKGERISDVKATLIERRGKEIERTIECTFHSDFIFDDARLLIIQNEIEGLYDAPEYLEHSATTTLDQIIDQVPDEAGFYSYEINYLQTFEIIGLLPKHWQDDFINTADIKSRSSRFLIEQINISDLRKQSKIISRKVDLTVKSKSIDTADVISEAAEYVSGMYDSPDYAASKELIPETVFPFNQEAG